MENLVSDFVRLLKKYNSKNDYYTHLDIGTKK